MKMVALTGVSGLALTFAVCILAQQTGDPSAVIKVIREDIKPGRDAAHEMVEAGYVRTLSKAKYPHYFALTPVSGPSEVWFIEGYPSFEAVGSAREMVDKSAALKAELDKLDSEDGELRTGGRVLLARYRKELSYLGDQYKNFRGDSHYANINIIRTRPGHGQEFLKMRGILNGAFEKMGMKRPILLYQVSSGMQTGTYLAFNGLPTLKALDPVEGEMTMQKAMGDNAEEYLKLMRDTVIGTESYTFAFSPKMSYVSDEVAAKDPAFWRPKAK